MSPAAVRLTQDAGVAAIRLADGNVGWDGVGTPAAGAGLSLTERWTRDGRWFATPTR
ncbi:hypothetical protein [Geodermatophilus maliterrae]|uniref:Uncharacterized protein n=1 Tax=Geodermatophilus maliterrae TaxID=3162531 RepID=A0ABV3XBP7_9ACTN